MRLIELCLLSLLSPQEPVAPSAHSSAQSTRAQHGAQDAGAHLKKLEYADERAEPQGEHDAIDATYGGEEVHQHEWHEEHDVATPEPGVADHARVE